MLNMCGEDGWVSMDVIYTLYVLYLFSQVQCRVFVPKSEHTLNFLVLQHLCVCQKHVARIQRHIFCTRLLPIRTKSCLKYLTLRKPNIGSVESGVFKRLA